MPLTDVPPDDFAGLYLSAHEQRKSAQRTCAWTIPMLRRMGVPSGRVLSVGCANGIDILEMRRHGYDAYGVDLYAPCDAAREWWKMAAADDLPYPSEYFSAVVMLEVIEHIPVIARAASAREICRVLCHGGTLLLATPNRLFPADEHGNPVRLHSPFRDETLTVSELEALFGESAECLSWAGYFQLQRFGRLGRAIKPVTRLFDYSPLHRSPLNPHLFLGFRMNGGKMRTQGQG